MTCDTPAHTVYKRHGVQASECFGVCKDIHLVCGSIVKCRPGRSLLIKNLMLCLLGLISRLSGGCTFIKLYFYAINSVDVVLEWRVYYLYYNF